MVQRFILNRSVMKRGLAEASKGRRPYEEQSQDSELTCEQELDFSYRVSRKFHTPLQQKVLAMKAEPRYLSVLATPLLTLLVLGFSPLAAQATCTTPKNAIEAENCLPGTPASQWYVQGAGSPNIQGF